MQDVGRLDEWISQCALTKLLFCFGSSNTNTTKDNNFFKIRYRILKNKRLFFKKMYEIITKQV